MVEVEFEEYSGHDEIFLKLDIPTVKIISTNNSLLPVLPIYFYVDVWITSKISATRVVLTPLRVLGMPDPSCDDSYYIPIPNVQHLFTSSLSLEVIRVGSISETGTSTGEILVGKAQIDLSKTCKGEVRGFFHLLKNVGTECSLQGQIEVNLELKLLKVLR
ncbi:hypothetical protein NE237_021184 [Protea cynaroides]|uniref:Uncharacterized protein n=1 Tax=Protea cynaroides TaxID=273540 RepID=A0A9Q0H8M9_9MAGN|nr:hypothetical protein NE237_021184 [Protea cynaroides]